LVRGGQLGGGGRAIKTVQYSGWEGNSRIVKIALGPE